MEAVTTPLSTPFGFPFPPASPLNGGRRGTRRSVLKPSPYPLAFRFPIPPSLKREGRKGHDAGGSRLLNNVKICRTRTSAEPLFSNFALGNVIKPR